MKYKFIEAKIDDLQLDPFNTRLPQRIKGRSEKDIIEWMLSVSTLFDLIASIGTPQWRRYAAKLKPVSYTHLTLPT